MRYETLVLTVSRFQKFQRRLFSDVKLFLDTLKSDSIRRNNADIDGLIMAGEKHLGSESEKNGGLLSGKLHQRIGKGIAESPLVFVLGKVELGALGQTATLLRTGFRKEFLHQAVTGDQFPTQFAAQSHGDFVTETAHLTGNCDDRHTARPPLDVYFYYTIFHAKQGKFHIRRKSFYI